MIARARCGPTAGRPSSSSRRASRSPRRCSPRRSGSSITSRETSRSATTSPTQHPEKLAELVEQWWVEAGKYNVLPLDSRMQLRMGERKPRHRARRQPARLLPGRRAAVRVHRGEREGPLAHDHGATSRFPTGGAEGVLLAHGSWFAGYSLYVKDGRLVLRAQLHGARRIPDRVDGRGADRPAYARVPLRAHRRASRTRDAADRRQAGRRRRDPAHRAARHRDVRRRPVLRLRQRPAGHARLRRAVPLHRAHRPRGGRDRRRGRIQPTPRRSFATRSPTNEPREGFMQRLLTLVGSPAILAMPLAGGGASRTPTSPSASSCRIRPEATTTSSRASMAEARRSGWDSPW